DKLVLQTLFEFPRTGCTTVRPPARCTAACACSVDKNNHRNTEFWKLFRSKWILLPQTVSRRHTSAIRVLATGTLMSMPNEVRLRTYADRRKSVAPGTRPS